MQASNVQVLLRVNFNHVYNIDIEEWYEMPIFILSFITSPHGKGETLHIQWVVQSQQTIPSRHIDPSD